MGLIYHHGCPIKELHKVAGRLESERERSSQPSDSSEMINSVHSSSSISFQPKRASTKDLPFIPPVEVQKHDGKDGRKLFIVVDDVVLDCTEYVSQHPGGKLIIQGFGGQDCSWQWWRFHSRRIWLDVAVGLRVGRTEGLQDRFVKPPAYVGLRPFGYQDD